MSARNPAGRIPRSVEFVYSRNDVLSFAFWKSWLPGEEEDRDAWVISDAWEFRGAGGRQRTLARQWDVEAMSAPTYLAGTEVATTFTDYLGEQPYVDYTVADDPNGDPQATEILRYLAGFGVHADQNMTQEFDPVTYHHGDLIRSTMLLTDESGAANQMAAYTAFGVRRRPAISRWFPRSTSAAGGRRYFCGGLSVSDYGVSPYSLCSPMYRPTASGTR